MRARDLGIAIGAGEPGPHDAITDVAGVRVGHTTLIEGDDVRTGVTVIVPHDGDLGTDPVFAGCHRLNGNGELTGLEWVRESGLLTTPIGLTNTHSVGVVRDALIAWAIHRDLMTEDSWSLPVVGETWDGYLNDINGLHVRPEHVFAAMEAAAPGPVAEGNVGSGTGMICHAFKGGIGTASRVLAVDDGGYTVGVLVQANHGARERLTIEGVPVGRELSPERVPLAGHTALPGSGSIIIVVATDAPLLPHQLHRLAQRAGLGVARLGGAGENGSGDIFIAFSTANPTPLPPGAALPSLAYLPDDDLDPLYLGLVEAVEEAVVNALVAAETMVGADGHRVVALDHGELVALMRRYGRIG
jgi:D-aminopeptidase